MVCLVVPQCLNHRLIDIELILGLSVAVAQQAMVHKGGYVVGIAVHVYAVEVKEACKVIEIHTVGAFLKTHAEQHRLHLCYAVTLGKETAVWFCLLQNLLVEL